MFNRLRIWLIYRLGGIQLDDNTIAVARKIKGKYSLHGFRVAFNNDKDEILFRALVRSVEADLFIYNPINPASVESQEA